MLVVMLECGVSWDEGRSVFCLRTVCFSEGGRKFHNALINTSSQERKAVFAEPDHSAYYYKTWREE